MVNVMYAGREICSQVLNSRRPRSTDLESVAFDQALPSLHTAIFVAAIIIIFCREEVIISQ